MTPRLVQVVEFDRPHGGSFVPVIEGLMATAAGRGWRTELVLPETAAGAEWVERLGTVARVRLAPADALRTRRTRARWLARQLAGDPGPTVLHTHFTLWDVAALRASRSRGVSGCSVFWHVHSALPTNPSMLARGTVKFGFFGRRVAGIICPAPNISLGVMQRLAPRDRVHFVPSALDAAAHPLADRADRTRARRELAIGDDAHVVLHFGWHDHLKGTDIFLATLAEMVARDDSVLGLIRGHEPVAERLARELGLLAHVRFQEPVERSPTLFAAADVVVSSSREEGMAYTVLEAVAAGTPVIATPIPGHTFIADAVAACRITRRDPAALADAALAAIAEPVEQRRREGRQAHEWVAENLSIERIAGRTIDLFDEAIGRREPAKTRVARSAAPRVIQVVRFPNAAPGSFVPMLAAAGRSAAALEAVPEVILGGESAGHPWVEDLREQGMRVRFAPAVGRDGTRRWLRDVAGESSGPVILHSHFTQFDLPVVAVARESPRVRAIWHVHSALSPSPAVYARNLIKFGLLARRVDRIICPAPDLADALRGRGAPAGMVEFIPNGIDPSGYRPASARQRAAARTRFGLPGEGPVALGFCWDWEVKGGELFARTVARAAAAIEGLSALQITTDPRSSRSAAALGLGDRLHTSAVVADATALYAAADIVLATSRREGGTPFAVLEALASGLPVVASDIPPHRFIADRSDAVTVVPREPEAFAAAALAALRSPSAEPVAGLPPEFTLERWSERVGAVYSDLIAAADGSSSRM